MKRTVLGRKHLGETLSRLRHKAGLTQEMLGKKASIHPTTLSRYERGKARIGESNLKKICEVIGCSPRRFLQEAWDLSQLDSDSRSHVAGDPEFPQIELERIYEESAGNAKNLYISTCRALFEALWKATRAH
jgi:transcriptional regulator with XRE-family HTH domain